MLVLVLVPRHILYVFESLESKNKIFTRIYMFFYVIKCIEHRDTQPRTKVSKSIMFQYCQCRYWRVRECTCVLAKWNEQCCDVVFSSVSFTFESNHCYPGRQRRLLSKTSASWRVPCVEPAVIHNPMCINSRTDERYRLSEDCRIALERKKREWSRSSGGLFSFSRTLVQRRSVIHKCSFDVPSSFPKIVH